ncbi:MAG: peptidoglycan DD-metalloendopeptidase family protein [Cyanobacteria bacterium P01_H01_bin.105]
MADFCPLSSVSSNPAESDNVVRQLSPKAIVNKTQSGRLWKKIGLVSSVALMGSQPVLAQIDIATGDVATQSVAAEATPFVDAVPETSEVSAAAAAPAVVSPEAASPAFSVSSVASESVEAITSQVEIEIVVHDAQSAVAEAVPIVQDDQSAVAETASDDDAIAAVDETDEAVDSDVETPEVDSIAEETEPDADAPISETEAIAEAETPSVEIVTPSDVVPDAIPTAEDLAADYGDVFVELAEEEDIEGETLDPDAPEVVVSERSTGCEYTVDADNITECEVSEPESTSESATVAGTPRAVTPETSINVGPVSISRSGVRFSGGATSVAGREFYNTVAKPLVDLQAGESFIFPLASPSPITSLFGWRWHPIHHDYRFHNGTDVGAPQGTPILATQSGQVSVADYLGGYGLTVILRHNDNTLESRYAHMSHMLVQPGEWVEQGDVIGLVGSTGNSTGPHLHFELHQLTSQGWTAINPDNVLRYALANINNRMVGNPLQALNIVPPAQAAAQAALPKAVKSETSVKDAPHFRPAQPNAQ